MKKKTLFPVSKGEFRAIVISSSVICIGVILPPHLARLVQPVSSVQIEITGLQSSYAVMDGTSSNFPYENNTESISDNTDGNLVDQNVSDKTKSKIYELGNAQFSNVTPNDPPINYEISDSEIAKSISGSIDRTSRSLFYAKPIRTNSNNYHRLPCSEFDPNSISSDSLQAWGISYYVVNNIQKYLKSGGKFRKPYDILKVYGMDSLMYGRVSNCIKIKKALVQPLFVNTSDTTQWKSLPGIGPVLSKRIVKFRDKLGGFHSIDQIADTYGLQMETFEGIRDHLRIRTRPQTMNLTTATAEQLAAHPYISQKQAHVIINYFNHHGRPKSLDDLSNLYIADSLWLDRIKPYCTIGQPKHE